MGCSWKSQPHYSQDLTWRFLRPQKLVVLGEVRWCQRVGEVYHAGLPIEGIIVGEQEESVHLDDDRLSLYLSGRGLTTPEVLAVQKHLDECVECRTRLSDTAEML